MFAKSIGKSEFMKEMLNVLTKCWKEVEGKTQESKAKEKYNKRNEQKTIQNLEKISPSPQRAICRISTWTQT